MTNTETAKTKVEPVAKVIETKSPKVSSPIKTPPPTKRQLSSSISISQKSEEEEVIEQIAAEKAPSKKEIISDEPKNIKKHVKIESDDSDSDVAEEVEVAKKS